MELPSGKLPGAIRLENGLGDEADVTKAGLIHFSTMLTEATDGGRTWSMPRSLGYGLPPHLLHHSLGMLILTYGHRNVGFGQRMGVSRDECQSC